MPCAGALLSYCFFGLRWYFAAYFSFASRGSGGCAVSDCLPFGLRGFGGGLLPLASASFAVFLGFFYKDGVLLRRCQRPCTFESEGASMTSLTLMTTSPSTRFFRGRPGLLVCFF